MDCTEYRMLFFVIGEKLDKDDTEEILKDCADEPDEDGFTPYQSEHRFVVDTLL